MKAIRKTALCLLIAVSVLVADTSIVHAANGLRSETKATASSSEFRGVWFSFRDWQAILKGKNEQELTASFDAVCKNAAASGLNAIIVHVRSHNDAVYLSSIYPWSDEMTGGDPGYDPLAIMVRTAHANGLSFHAWINPYGYRNGEYCGDASLATHDNIILGIREILENYEVDGIHFDDYFPPIGADVHNTLLKDVYAVVHSYGKVFGVSPSGNIDNNISAGADVKTWMSETGYMDYICPQLYWTDHYGKNGNVTMFSDRLKAWRSINKAGIPMYIGLASYKAGEGSSSDKGWVIVSDNLATQINKLRDSGCKGYILYSYSSVVSNAATEMEGIRAINR